MPMSEDVASTTIAMAGRVVTGSVELSTKALEALIRLLHEMNEAAQKREERKLAEQRNQLQPQPKGNSSNPSAVQTDMLEQMKMKGRVSLPDLRAFAEKNHEQIIYSEQGLTKEDVSLISKNAKKMGIPVAFSRGVDKKTYYPCVCSADAQPFKIMLQGIIANKLNADREKPADEREFRQLAVAKWELPFISQECQRLDIQGSFAPHPTERNQVIFVYRKGDEDQALSIINQIEQSCKELKDVKITPDNEGFVTVKDNLTGRTYSFDTSNTSEEVLINELQDQLGFDSMKAKLTAAKFESEHLSPEQIEDFKQNDPHNAFFSFGEIYIPDKETGNENPLTEPYKMGYFACKYDDKPCFTLSNPQGKTVVFTADKISYLSVRQKLSSELGIKDRKLLNALTDKVIQCSRSMAKENMNTEISFSDKDFDMSDPQIASGMRRTTPDGSVFVKKQPLESLSIQISRTDKDSFTVTSTAQAVEYDESGNANTSYNTREMDLSLKDRKKSYESIKNALTAQGVPPETAKKIARETVTKAQCQPEKETVYVERMTPKSAVLFTNVRRAEIPVRDGAVSPNDVADALGVSTETAQQISDNMQENLPLAAQQRVESAQETKTDFNTAMNRMTEREQNRSDNLIVCNADHPEKHIVISGSHNGTRVIHDYAVMNGEHNVGNFTDANTKDENGKPIIGAFGRHEWTNLKSAMSTQIGIVMNSDDPNVLVFDSPEAYEQYLEDTAFLQEFEQEEQLVDVSEETAAEEVATSSNSESSEQELNGHEQHPEGNILAEQSDDSTADILGDDNSSNDAASALTDALDSIVEDDDEDSMSIGAR